MNGYYETARRLGIDVLYDCARQGPRHSGRRVRASAVVTMHGQEPATSRRRRVVVASGGFEANIEWLKQLLGRRGRQLHHSRHAVQHGHDAGASLLEHGAKTDRRPAASSTPWPSMGARPKFDGGIVTRLDSVPFGIVVNRDGAALLRRGRGLLAEALRDLGRPDRAPARSDRLLDHRRADARQVHAVGVPARRGADRSGALAEALELDPAAVDSSRSRVTTASCRAGTFDPGELDDCHTEGLDPPKSHWAVADREAAVLRLSAATGHHLYLHGRHRGRAGPRHHARRASARRTSSRPARSWPATSSGAATWPASD